MFILKLSLFALAAVTTLAADGLNIRAKAAGKLYFGSATDNGELNDVPYTKTLSNTSDFGQITPGNSMKWDATEKSRNVFSYANGDSIVSLAAGNGQLLRCHTLVWHSQLPSWISSGDFDNATLVSIMRNHVTNLVTHWKGKCYAWDVVNEALNEDGTYRTSVFYNTIGPAFIPIAFAAAAAADPSAKLYYNDYNLESAGAKSKAAANIVKQVQSYGAKIDGVGAQAHLIVGSVGSASSLQSNIQSFTSLGVEFAYTELDIRSTTPMSDSTKAQQASDYAAVTTACKNVAKCVGITIWDYTDKYSWIPSVFAGQGEALPWDLNFVKKAAYTAILNAWGTAPSGGSSPTVVVPSNTKTSAIGSPTAIAARYAQCGGSGYTGPTQCAIPWTCIQQNEWFYQCL
ncbi:putative endo-1,4-beta-xylanase [Pseudovirgaria hyperparasitica]|uniref:Beta-xylanase n=1 Tax=Pseudovirgaria hyperparasitica TaxID=470096 RepID=A0A6A6W6L1_9PEZI|nr:putative endo-1,4-beta-xylanase [Pseudovirgaria hyperparasitica]KAF2757207.1 putative endo-1,4-beta-xylanase [Pseudovirgaria hyperparasitica]